MNHTNLPKGWHFATHRELDKLPAVPKIHMRCRNLPSKGVLAIWDPSGYVIGDRVCKLNRKSIYYILPNRTRNLPPSPEL